MDDYFIGEIRMFAGDYPPLHWELCDGRVMKVAEHQQLHLLLGTKYGGDGVTTFALPDLRGRVPIHKGDLPVGAKGGSERVVLTTAQLPAHSHAVAVTPGNPDTSNAAGNMISNARNIYRKEGPHVTLSPKSITAAGGGQPHENMMPFVTVNYIIAVSDGAFPEA
jgi:microcystin-dependent protein